MTHPTPTPSPTKDRLSGDWALPKISHWLVRLFRRYARRYVRNAFHSVSVSRSGFPFPPPGQEPILIVLNHPSWWDPMIALVLSQTMTEREHFAPIDAKALQQYPFLKRLGFIGVEGNSLRGASEFVRAGTTILAQENRVFWVTAQGQFSDVRTRPLGLRVGVGYLAARLPRGLIVPLALEYPYWNERTPEALVRVGSPLVIEEHPGLSGREWTTKIEVALTETLDALNAEAIARDPSKFNLLLGGTAGVGGVYDWWRGWMAWFRGKKFDPSHDHRTGEDRS